MNNNFGPFTQSLDMKQKLRESEEKYRLLFETAYDGILLIDDSKVVDCNQRTADMFGCVREQVLGASIERFIPYVQKDGRISRELFEEKRRKVLEGEPKLFEMVLCRCDGSEIDVELSLNYIKLEGRPMIQAIVRDITDRKQMEEWIRYLNLYDKPTGLYNRNYFEEEMQRMQTGRYNPVGIVICDVDGLKLINDNLGHEAGDAVLAAAAQILSKSFRESDVVARIGGDEFAVLLPNCPTELVEKACKRIRKSVADYRNSSPAAPLSLSIGWAVKTNSSKSMMDIFKEADNNMYREKPKNREMFRELFNETLNRLNLES